MDRNDQQAIEHLFSRLTEAERKAPPRDAEAETFINRRIAAQPAAPYFMAQTIVMLERALAETNARVEALEGDARAQPKRSGGLFGGLFGDDAPRSPNAMPRVAPRRDPMQTRGGGGFLAGAAQTAVGVAGGVLLGSAIGGMFGAGAAEAAPAEEPVEEPAEEPVEDSAGDGDFGDFEL